MDFIDIFGGSLHKMHVQIVKLCLYQINDRLSTILIIVAIYNFKDLMCKLSKKLINGSMLSNCMFIYDFSDAIIKLLKRNAVFSISKICASKLWLFAKRRSPAKAWLHRRNRTRRQITHINKWLFQLRLIRSQLCYFAIEQLNLFCFIFNLTAFLLKHWLKYNAFFYLQFL